MWLIRAIMVWVVMAASCPSLAQDFSAASPPVEPVMTIISHLDLNSFPNSTGPGRQLSAHTPGDYGFIKIESFPDGWVQLSQPDDSWHLGVVMLEEDKRRAILCFADSGGSGGTYRSTHVLEIRFQGHALWTGVPIADRSDCKNAPPERQITADVAGPAPAAILQHLNDFRDSLSVNDRHLLDHTLRRSTDGGIAQCDGGQGGRASCEVT